jgi:hypothetical protein
MRSKTEESATKPQEKDTTIKVPVDLKGELDAIKADDQESYAGVIRRLIAGREPTKSNGDTVNLSLPRKVYQLVLMVLPANMSDQVRKGVK